MLEQTTRTHRAFLQTDTVKHAPQRECVQMCVCVMSQGFICVEASGDSRLARCDLLISESVPHVTAYRCHTHWRTVETTFAHKPGSFHRPGVSSRGQRPGYYSTASKRSHSELPPMSGHRYSPPTRAESILDKCRCIGNRWNDIRNEANDGCTHMLPHQCMIINQSPSKKTAFW